MGLFNKLKDALFEEETVEIPVITKKEKPVKKEEPVKKKEVEPVKLAPKEEKEKDDVKVTKINIEDTTTLVDMPKLKTETHEEKKSQVSRLTFPVFDDEDEEPVKEVKRTTVKTTIKTPEMPKKTTTSRNLLQDDFYDFNDAHNRVAAFKAKSSTRRPSEPTHFTPSPIISPVYGILNEDYKKEDIVTRGEKKMSSYEKLDLDEVRKKAYGTLEDEIEKTLTKIDIEETKKEEKHDVGVDELKDDGISIDDLLTDKDDITIGEAMEAEKEIDLDDEIRDIEEDVPEEPKDEIKEKEEVKEEKEIKEEQGEDDDLFDLIDSLYARKGE